jgi:hypothetical protein
MQCALFCEKGMCGLELSTQSDSRQLRVVNTSAKMRFSRWLPGMQLINPAMDAGLHLE